MYWNIFVYLFLYFCFRIACGIIARSAGLFENEKRVCACTGKTLWEEREEIRHTAKLNQKEIKREIQLCWSNIYIEITGQKGDNIIDKKNYKN